jgi:hypothetical protein
MAIGEKAMGFGFYRMASGFTELMCDVGFFQPHFG